jgi:ribosomal protein S18 acetylase RimI-like enzyme
MRISVQAWRISIFISIQFLKKEGWIMMKFRVRKYQEKDLPAMVRIWNEVVADGIAFPQEDLLDESSGREFFAAQTYCGAAEDEATGKVYGLYILHPNNVGRCGHICNASYAVSKDSRSMHIGEMLVKDSLAQGKMHGYRVMQFNAVVASNLHARHLYERLGFQQLGTIPGGFRMKDGRYEDICPYYHEL